MRNYWLRIALGALAIFVVGMIGVSLARRGMGHVRGVVEGSGPISFPLAFVPFKLDGQRLGSVDKVTLQRDAPKRISGVELQIKLRDSLVARGLEGCRLLANFEDRNPDARRVEVGPFSKGVFTCVQGDDSTGEFQDFGHAVLQPGNISVPLLLPNDIVDDLKKGDLGSEHDDSAAAAAEVAAESIADAAEAQADSISQAAEKHAESVVARSQRLIDSLTREGLRRQDSVRRRSAHVADSARRR
jgi:hypothetical protein